MACESPIQQPLLDVLNVSILPDSLVKQGLTLCWNDPTKFICNDCNNMNKFPDDKSRAAYIANIVNMYDIINIFSEKDLLEPPKNEENMKKLMEITNSANAQDAMSKYIEIKLGYQALLSAIKPLPTNTGNPNSEYKYQLDDLGLVVIRCTVCKNNYAGNNCDKCAKGFGTGDGLGDCSLCNDDYCSGHGRNCVVVNGIPKCMVCDPSFGGNDCATRSCWGTPGNPCEGRGKCNTLTGICDCYEGFYGPDCTGTGPTPGRCPNDCSGHGKCDRKTRRCACDPGFIDTDCSGGAPVPKSCPNACSGHGKCDVTTGLCACDLGYSGLDCSGSAPVPKPCPNACSSRGKCDGATGLCTCNTGYSGPDCSGSAPVPKPCPNACSGRGVCDNSTGKCTCTAGSGGADCAGCQKTLGDAVDCSGNGKCVENSCGCVPGWSGTYCESKSPEFQCPSDKSGNLCGNNGSCVGEKCQCRAGWRGSDCSKGDDGSLFMWLGLGLMGILVVVFVFWWRSRKSLNGFGV